MSENYLNAKYEATRVTLIGMALDIVLAAAKVIGGIFTQSFALIADGIHSLSDAATDIFVIIVTRVAHTPPDQNHPYGHGRFETLGTVGMGIVFITTAGILIYDAYLRLLHAADLPKPALAGIGLALASIAGKEYIYHYTMRTARKLNSSLLRANAWHSRSDAISSIAVLIGIIAAQQGYPWMDTVAAIFVALIIAKIGWELCSDSIRELVDTAISDERLQAIQDTVMKVHGVHGTTNLRSRLSGGKIILELNLLVDPRISVSEGHQLGELVSMKLLENFSDIGDVVVHIDPQMHIESDVASELPGREEVLESIYSELENVIDRDVIEAIDLHYLDRGIELDITVGLDTIPDQVRERLEEVLVPIAHFTRLRIFTKLCELELDRKLS